MSKKRLIIIVSIIVGALVIAGLYGTFAASSTASNDNTYAITLTGSTGEVVVPANGSKTVIYQITNTNKGTVQYGVVYSGDNISVKIYSNSQDSHTGTIDYGENKFIKLYLENSGTSDSTASIKSILGYENGGSLDSLVPSGYSLVSESYSGPSTLISHITNLYTSGSPTLITQENSNDTYYYSYQDNTNTWGLMNDGLKIDNTLDATTTGLATSVTNTTALTSGAEGNIRYFGPSDKVNNYIYFNCNDYSNQSLTDANGEKNCELWRIIGIVDGKVKIIKNDSIGNLAWDQDKNQDSTKKTYNNNWGTSSLQEFLNGLYYNRGTIESHPYYSGSTGTTTTTLNLKTIGITEATRNNNLILESTWYLGGYSTSSGLYPNDIYNYERQNKVGTTIYSTNDFIINKNIGLMYASDYGYGTDLTKCSKYIYNYETVSACTTGNWLFNNTNQWLITPRSSSSNNAWNVGSTGYVGYSSRVYSTYLGVRPVLYLDSELGMESGHEGTSIDPYRISIS